ncbi:unnamed protein product [Ophioblennius macclurei]
MADKENTNMEVDKERDKSSAADELARRIGEPSGAKDGGDDAPGSGVTAEYCEKLQAWMWQYYSGYVSWQSWLAASAMSCPYYLQPPGGGTSSFSFSSAAAADFQHHSWLNAPFSLTLSPYPPAAGGNGNHHRAGEEGGNNNSGAAVAAQPQQQQQQPQENGNAPRPGREYSIPSPLQRLMAEMVDFFILFFIKATIIISIMHLSGIKDVSKFAMHFIVEEIDEDTSMEELQKMMLVALVYRILVCFYEIVCIWGAGGATPGKFLIGLRVVTCDSSVLVQPNRVLVVPATNVSLSASTVRALNKNFSIAFFFPAFITLLFFQHNRTVYDMVAGTIVVKRSRAR